MVFASRFWERGFVPRTPTLTLPRCVIQVRGRDRREGEGTELKSGEKSLSTLIQRSRDARGPPKKIVLLRERPYPSSAGSSAAKSPISASTSVRGK